MFDNKFMIIGRGALKKVLKLDIHITFYPSDTTHRFQYVMDNIILSLPPKETVLVCSTQHMLAFVCCEHSHRAMFTHHTI